MKSQFINIKAIGTRAGRALASIFMLVSTQVKADVIITPAEMGKGISADRAFPSPQQSYTPIGDIVLKEQGTRDFAFTDRYWRSLVLTAPAGWEFKPGAGKIQTSAPSDFRVTDIKVTAQTITLRFCVRTTEFIDELIVSGIEVKAMSGIINPGTAHIYRSSENPGNALVSHIVSTRHPLGLGGTSFAGLSLRPGKVQKLIFAQKPQATAEGKELDGATEVQTVDQFGNFSVEGLPANLKVKLKLTGNADELSGAKVMDIGTTAGNGKVVFQGLSIRDSGMKKLVATAASLTFAVTNDFLIYDPGLEVPATGVDADYMCIK